jgi:hypothetical protein
MVNEIFQSMRNIRFSVNLSMGWWAIIPLLFLGCESPISNSVYYGSKEAILQTPVAPDTSTWPTGTYIIRQADLTGDLLVLRIECATDAPSDINLIVWKYWLMSDPPGIGATISVHPGSEATPLRGYTIVYDLTPVKEAYRQQFHSRTGTLVLSINWKNGRTGPPVIYEF